ncbi:MAG TPA: CRTAC1 family protein [Opitutus sp.]|nr:CRTAC1 family protein [Opitutus sp.]
MKTPRALGSTVRRGASAEPEGATQAAERSNPAPRIPPLLPVLLPLVVAAIFTGVLFAWLFPPVAPGKIPPTVRFTDVTAASGLAGWSDPGLSDPPTTLGGGVVCFDYDADGDVDLLFINGAPWSWEESLAKRITRGSCVLYRNDGSGHFTDVTALAGLNVDLQGMGAAAGDFDNDGLPDLYITCVGSNHLFHNRGKGRFEDVTELAGVGGEDNTWSTGAAWIDYDNDGRLDLVVGHYARWAQEMPLEMAFTVAKVGHSYGAPTGFVGVFPSLYRNLGDGRFSIVRDAAGLRAVDPQTGFPIPKTLAVVPVDVNEDGKFELLFTYHTDEAALFLNQADGTFRRWAGGADPRREGISAGLGSASSLPFAQLSGTNERFSALQAATRVTAGSDGHFASLATKLAVALLDYDLDGRVDVFTAQGRAERDVGRFEQGRDFSSTPALRWNRGNGWVEIPIAGTGEMVNRLAAARAVATADFDGDGDLDIVVAQHHGPPQLLRNDQRANFPWLQIELKATRGVRISDGARVEVHTPGRVWVQTAGPAMSYLAQSTSTLTFGLGDDARVRRVVVHWPSGARTAMRPEGVNRKLVITEPD